MKYLYLIGGGLYFFAGLGKSIVSLYPLNEGGLALGLIFFLVGVVGLFAFFVLNSLE